jgi:hypothetical protein
MVRFAERTLRKEDRRHFIRTGRGNVAEQVDDTGAKVKYMEKYLSKDKKYVPYEQQQQYQEEQDRKKARQKESADNQQPILVILCIVVVGAIAAWQLGFFNSP